MSEDIRIIHGDCLDVLPTLESRSIDCVVTDPPYPEVNRDYGRWTEAEWHDLMRSVVSECRRVLTPTGSAVFILQPTYEGIGRVRPWLWEFLAWTAREWNQVQDAWWWNFAAIPQECSMPGRGLLKPSVKACVWLGPPDCYRDQDSVLWDVSEQSFRRAQKASGRGRVDSPSGHGMDGDRAYRAAVERGGTSPMNLIPFANSRGHESGGGHGHGAATPIQLCRWWVRYLCPRGGLVLDPFAGTSTVGLAAWDEDRRYIGIERLPHYYDLGRRRLDARRSSVPLFAS